MSKTSSAIEIATTTCKVFAGMCDIPVLSSLKPLGSILVIICEHVSALQENKEAAITLAERVGLVAQVLVNCAEERGPAMPVFYSHQIGNLKNILFDISEALQMLRRPKSRWLRFVQIFSPKTTNAALNQLSSKLDSTLWLSTFSTCCEIRRDIQRVHTHLQEGGSCSASSKLRCTEDKDIEPTEIDSGEELYSTEDYSVQIGTYRNQEVIIRKYYTEKEKIFLQELNQRLDQTHPGIAIVLGSSNARRIILLRAQDLIFCTQDVADIESIRRPWQERRIGPPIPSVNGHTSPGETRSAPVPTRSAHSTPNDGEILSAPFGILTVKESDALLQQFISVVKFLRRMGVKVSWWQFKPSWVALRKNKHVVLIDWAEDSKSGGDGEFEPRYAIHLMGLGFSDIIPDVFQDLGRLLAGIPGTTPASEFQSLVGSSRNSLLTPFSRCRCPKKGGKPSRHWRTECPYNPNRISARLFECSICGQKFNRKDNLTRHLRNRHNTEPEPESYNPGASSIERLLNRNSTGQPNQSHVPSHAAPPAPTTYADDNLGLSMGTMGVVMELGGLSGLGV